MVSAIGVSWFVGFALLLVFLFSIQDINAIFESDLQLPVAQLFSVRNRSSRKFISTHFCKYRMLWVHGRRWPF
jgi:predicted RecB family endonuclease